MSDEKDFLKILRRSLDEEEDDTSIIPILENHHKYLKEYISIFMDSATEVEDKVAAASLFFPIFHMHARAEEETFYHTLQRTYNQELRLHGLCGQDEHEIAHQLVEELKNLGIDYQWSEEIDAKILVLSGLVKNHLKEEENVMFPKAQELLPESKLISLAEDYLEQCRSILDMELETQKGDPSLVASRSDVITLFY